MKRDMELIREILLLIEERQHATSDDLLKVIGETQENADRIAYHLDMLVEEAGYIKGVAVMGMSNYGHGYMMLELTWSGHEFVDTLRDQTVWEKTRSVANTAGVTSAKALLDIGKAVVASVIASALKGHGIG